MTIIPFKKASDNVMPMRRFDDFKIASPWTRFLAQLIDQSVVLLVCVTVLAAWFPAQSFTPRWWATLTLLWIFASTLTQCFFIWFYKNTPGKKALGLSLQSAKPNQEIGVAQVLIRSFI